MKKRPLLFVFGSILLPLTLFAQEQAPPVVRGAETGLAADEVPLIEPGTAAEQPEPDIFARDSYRIDPVVCPFKGDIEYEPGDIECGLLQVPENRENTGSRFIELHFVKLNSRWGKDEDKKDDDEKASSLTPGKLADLIVLDRDIFDIPAQDIPEAQVLLTILGGQPVYYSADLDG